ncbi:hypothetical protein J4N42_15425 [Vibrio sp. SCSIO 43135]|uniref:hypothetical protein n=1 Tax=Vibrio sp. SCSIO 43135 TaxID=2819096 RepID=UPI002076015A|nr:hypothetical protein [Vibrio sp. SCSIO 43135]USD43566.1 hypothetical protein J4N42_15425 [Vibrio sp. SCSIO 43135]
MKRHVRQCRLALAVISILVSSYPMGVFAQQIESAAETAAAKEAAAKEAIAEAEAAAEKAAQAKVEAEEARAKAEAEAKASLNNKADTQPEPERGELDSSPEYFIGLIHSRRLSGKFHFGPSSDPQDLVYDADGGAGIKVGALYRDTHRLSLEATFHTLRISQEDLWDTFGYSGSRKNIDATDLAAKYDYVWNLDNEGHFSTSLGAKVGYRFVMQNEDTLPMSAFFVGAQAGVYYKFTNWSIGTELAYQQHKEFKTGSGSVSFGGETMLNTSLSYHY